ncbi:metal-dependent hydrolase [Candidatus Woesearchaeota archaeon]|nr:metal-dependent hydrolase [Candidatus Woesearchaeota archaeon]
MLGRTHLVVAFFVFLLLSLFLDVSNPVLFAFFLLFGSLFPDIDRSSSILGRKAKFVSWFFSHRGFFHSFYAMILFSLVIYLLFDLVLALAFLIGFSSHLFLDSFTKLGISFFLVDKKIRGRLVTGGLFDKAMLLAFSFLDIYLLILVLA